MSTDAHKPAAFGTRTTVITVRMLSTLVVAALLILLTPLMRAHADSYPPSSGASTASVSTAPTTDTAGLLRGRIDQAEPVAGKSVTVVGQGFAAGEMISVGFRSSKREFGQAIAGQDGSASLTFIVPTAMQGAQNITLTGLSSGRVASIGITFIAPPAALSGDATNAAVVIVGLVGLGIVLLAGGVALLAVGRRHALADPELAAEMTEPTELP